MKSTMTGSGWKLKTEVPSPAALVTYTLPAIALAGTHVVI